jgi:hypothetical protein
MAMKRFIHIRVALAVAACAALAAAPGSADAVTMTPAGAAFTAATVGGGGATINFPTGAVFCRTVTTTGTIPSGQNNPNPNGSVTMTVTTPTFRECTAYSFPATVQANAIEGTWSMSFTSVQGAPTVFGTLTAPSLGLLVTLTSPYSCIITGMRGTQTPGTGVWSNIAHALTLTRQQVPIVENGAICPPRAQFGNLSVALTLVAGVTGVGITAP